MPPLEMWDLHCEGLMQDYKTGHMIGSTPRSMTIAQLIFRMDMRARLDGFTVPTTIIQPRHDPAVTVEIGQYLAARWPQARLEVIDAAGHLPQMTDPEILIKALERAL